MTRTVLRGRSDAMSRALDALRRSARTGQGAVVAISGEPGIGKSAVLRDLVEQASRAGFLVGAGKAEHGDQIAPGAPLLVALRSGPRPLLSGEAFAGLASLYDKPLWLVDRISALVEDLAADAPVLIAIDDMHWADRLTRFALRVLPARLARSPVVWAVTSRKMPGDPLAEVIADIDDDTAIVGVSLGPLPGADIEALAADRLGAAPSAQTRALLARVGGNPFWAVQVLDGLARRRGHADEAGGLAAELAVGVRSRLADFTAEAAALVRLVAVWGRPLDIEDATQLLGISEADAAARIDESAANGLLTSDGAEVGFAHDLVREAVYAAIAPDDRRALHRACARHIVGKDGSILCAARHFRASAVKDDEEAILALEKAARESASIPGQAVELAEQAFALTSVGHPLWLLAGERTVETLVKVQRETEALAVADRLLAVAVEPETVARLELQACLALWCAGESSELERRASAALARRDASAEVRARLSAVRALGASRVQSTSAAEGLAKSALAEGRRLADQHAQRMALVALIEVARNEGRHRLALDRFADLRRLSDTAYQAEEIRTLQHLDRYDEAEAMLAKIREAQDGADSRLPSVLYAQMWQDHNLARFDAADAGARTLLRLAEETGNSRYRLSARLVLTAVAMYRGDRPAATQLLELGHAESTDDGLHRCSSLLRGWLKAGAGDFTASVAILAPLLDDPENARAAWMWSPPWMRTLAAIGLNAGDRSFCAGTARMAETAAQRNPGVASVEGTALHIRGLLDADIDMLAEAVRVLRGSPRPLLIADALRDLGATQLNQDGDGVTALTEAADIYQRVGAVSGSRAVAKILREHGVRGARPAGPRPSTGWSSLTDTEHRVVELISSGHTNRSAAMELGVSPNTVNAHLRSVFRKLEVRSRVQLTIAFRERATQ
ncbi:helix-turn-helix transcriptional regulator [Mycolicibacterium litorale]|uniref:LuxR family transcriptional regulator n=1 Tax=Mycolicibacterium litorale TaxID=758802 RepID=A0AAD1INF8_9MYCO|nr:AAA family ATPase [Mycolicibacterium litorale]MCV7416928.1 AAA family ATPase [Mycolicibacterium litorale]TDY04713.1 putative ATPase [Mycolicibacterium litorale]BBY18141.1 LuxR family transcriptional regulator [Mycolicibacterium litorale]